MTVDRRLGTKVDKAFRREEATGTRVDPYPYIGVVKNNLDPQSKHRNNWTWLRYAILGQLKIFESKCTSHILEYNKWH